MKAFSPHTHLEMRVEHPKLTRQDSRLCAIACPLTKTRRRLRWLLQPGTRLEGHSMCAKLLLLPGKKQRISDLHTNENPMRRSVKGRFLLVSSKLVQLTFSLRKTIMIFFGPTLDSPSHLSPPNRKSVKSIRTTEHLIFLHILAVAVPHSDDLSSSQDFIL